MTVNGAIFVSIDKTERTVLEYALASVFGSANQVEELVWTQATANSQLPAYSTNHEYVEVYARDRAAVEADPRMFREPKPGYAEVMLLLARLQPTYAATEAIEGEIRALYDTHAGLFREEWESHGGEWNRGARRQDPWRGIYPYNRAEYRDRNGRLVTDEDAARLSASIWVWSEIPTSAPASKQSQTTKDPDHPNFRYYRPVHPVTGRPCPHPQSGWKFPLRPDPRSPDRRSFLELEADHRIAWGEDERKVPRTKGFLHEVETNVSTSVFYEYNDGEAELSELFGESGLFLSPKSSRFVRRFLVQTTQEADWFMDFFAGSGSSGHGVLAQNRIDGGKRKQVLVEVEKYFDTLLLPRMKKAIYSTDWRNGAPVSRDGSSAALKYIRLESYEDALANLELRRTPDQQELLDLPQAQGPDRLKEQFILRYILDVESRGSQSLLNIAAFTDPMAYQLKVRTPGSDESRMISIDLIETFNWLIGLTVQRIAAPQTFTADFERDGEQRLRLRGRLRQEANGPWWFRTISGTMPDGRRTLVIWRRRPGGETAEGIEEDNLLLDEWFTAQGYLRMNGGYALIYVNGDNNLMNLMAAGNTCKVRMIEEDFHRLMFEIDGI
jgi:adenine-specific DNA-methyltransferase